MWVHRGISPSLSTLYAPRCFHGHSSNGIGWSWCCSTNRYRRSLKDFRSLILMTFQGAGRVSPLSQESASCLVLFSELFIYNPGLEREGSRRQKGGLFRQSGSFLQFRLPTSTSHCGVTLLRDMPRVRQISPEAYWTRWRQRLGRPLCPSSRTSSGGSSCTDARPLVMVWMNTHEHTQSEANVSAL